MKRANLIEKMQTLDYWIDDTNTTDSLKEFRLVIIALAQIPLDDATGLIDAYVPGPLKTTFYRLTECEKSRNENLQRLLKKQADK